MTQRKPISLTLLYGGIAALGMIVFTFCTYKAGTDTFLGPVVWAMYLLPLTCGVIAGLTERKRQGGYLDFRGALKIIFGIFVLALAVQVLFTWLLVHVIDPHFGEALGPAVLAKMEAAYRRFNYSDDEIRRNIEAAKGTDAFSFGSILLGLARDYVLGFLICLVLAAIIKRKKPQERQATL
jgi:hypothetical protein